MRKWCRAGIAVVAALALVFGIDPGLAYADTANFTGSVQDTTNAPLTEVDVEAIPWDASSGSFDGPQVFTRTDPNGRFGLLTSNLVTGWDYALKFTKDGYWPAWWGSGSNAPSGPGSATVNRATPGSDLGVVTLTRQYRLTGSLATPDGVTLLDASVRLYASQADYEAGDYAVKGTVNGGEFSVPIPADADAADYVLGIEGYDMVGHTQPVTLSQANLDLGEIALTPTFAMITGKVSPASTAPDEVLVTALTWDADRDRFAAYRWATPEPDGTFVLQVLAGQRYTVSYELNGHAKEYLGGGYSRPRQVDDATSTRLARSATDPVEALPEVELDPTHEVTGTLVTDTTPVTHALVRAYRADHVSGDEILSQSWSDDAGHFGLQLPDGSNDVVVLTDSASPDVLGRTLAAQPIAGVTDLGEIALQRAGSVRQVQGRVVSQAGDAVAGAKATVFRWRATGPEMPGLAADAATSDDAEGEWVVAQTVTTDAAGRYRFEVNDQSVVTVRARRNGFRQGWLGSISKPSEPTAATSALVDNDRTLPELTLFPTADRIGKVAGQDFDYCTANVLPANDDAATPEVALPFALKFFGRDYSALYVNNNGSVSFGEPAGSLAPEDLTAPEADVPLIAPFLANVDTRNDDSWEVTYGASADGRTFCANWSTVGYYSRRADNLNIFQLLLTSRTGESGRSAGDFDITFNYDQVQWETGDSEIVSGTPGLGGISAAVGFTAGTPDAGTSFQLPGSLVPGSFVDGGPSALISHQLNSSQIGRYRFEVRNSDAQVKLGGVHGTLRKDGGAVLAGAQVTACLIVDTVRRRCDSTTSDASGRYGFPALLIGTYHVTVSPPGGLRSQTSVVAVEAGVDKTADFTLHPPRPLPSGVVLKGKRYEPTVTPSIYWAEPITVTIDNLCPTGTPSAIWELKNDLNVVVRRGNYVPTYAPGQAEDPAVLAANLPTLYPEHGAMTFEIVLSCDGVITTTVGFDLYVDPSGTIYDDYGLPQAGASVALQRADARDGEFTTVPDGSTLMSPGNRLNPMTTGADGRFGWDVAPGWYRLKVAKAGCTPVTSSPMEVPPPRVLLAVKLSCPAPVPVKAVAISGATSVGGTLTAAPADFGFENATSSYRWLRDGAEVGSGQTHAVSAADQGHTLAVEQTLQAAPVLDPLDSSTVAFAPLTVRASLAVPAAVTPSEPESPAQPTHPPVKPAEPSEPALGTLSGTLPKVAGKAKVKSKLTAKVGAWSPSGVALGWQWLRSGTVIPGATGTSYKVQPSDGGAKLSFRVTGTKAGYATLVKESVPTKMVPWSKLKTATPKIKGKTLLGATLTASAGRWTSGAQLGYQWLRAGKVVAAGTTYTLTAADLGKAIKVKVTGTKQGFKTVARTSKATKKVK